MSLTLIPTKLEHYIIKIQPSVTAYIAFSTICCLPALLVALLHVVNLRNRQADPEGCRKLGLSIQSNLADEHEKRYSGKEASGAGKWTVKSLWIYPVKSCRGVELERGTVVTTGMEYDRQFSFAQLSSKLPVDVDVGREEKALHRWRFITQRGIAAMANIRTELWVPDISSPTYSAGHPNIKSGGVLVIKFPNLKGSHTFWGKAMAYLGQESETTVHMPYNPTSEQIARSGYEVEKFEIWKDHPTSLLMASTQTSNTWIQDLRSYLGVANHLGLFRVMAEDPREVYRCAPGRDQLGYQSIVGFQDAYPLHILNVASVQDVAAKFEKQAPRLSVRNFRPNIVITGGKAYAEDSWKRAKIDTGIRHGSEPNRTLKQYRRIDEGDRKNACLGMQMVPALENSMIKVGDPISVLETGHHLYIKQ